MNMPTAAVTRRMIPFQLSRYSQMFAAGCDVRRRRVHWRILSRNISSVDISKLNLPPVSFDSIRYGSALATVDVNNRSSMTLIIGSKPRILRADDHPVILAETTILLRRDR